MRVTLRSMFWIAWSILWIIGNIFFENAGLIGHHALGYLLLECVLSCFAAYVMAHYIVAFIILTAYLVIMFVLNIGLVGWFCLVMNLGLAIVTKLLTQK